MGQVELQPIQEFQSKVTETLDKFQSAFIVLQQENNPGWIQVRRTGADLEIEVQKVGKYFFSADEGKRYFIFQSP